MRPLTDRQASACEHAKSKRCRCRCGGALHGAARVSDRSQLPASDPHGPGSGQIQLEAAPSGTTYLVDYLGGRGTLRIPASTEGVMDAIKAGIAAGKAAGAPGADQACAEAGHPIQGDGVCACGLAYDPERFDPEDDGSQEDPEAYE